MGAMGAAASTNVFWALVDPSFHDKSGDAEHLLPIGSVLTLVTSTLPHALVARVTRRGDGSSLRGRDARALRGVLEQYDQRLRDVAGIDEGTRKAVLTALANRIGVRHATLPAGTSNVWDGTGLLFAAYGSSTPDPALAVTPVRWLRERLATAHDGDFLPGYALVAAQAERYACRARDANIDGSTRIGVRTAVMHALSVRWGIDSGRARDCLDAWDIVLGLALISHTGVNPTSAESTVAPAAQTNLESRAQLRPAEKRRGQQVTQEGSRSRDTESPRAASDPSPRAPSDAERQAASAWVSPPKIFDVEEYPESLEPDAVLERLRAGSSAKGVPSTDILVDGAREVLRDPDLLPVEEREVVPDKSVVREQTVPILDVIPVLPSPRVAAALAFFTFGYGYTMYWLWSTWANAYHEQEKPPSRAWLTLGSVVPVIGWGIVLTRALRIERACGTTSNEFDGRALAQAALYTTFSILILTDTLWIELAGLACVSMMAAIASQTSATARRLHHGQRLGSRLPLIFAWVLGAAWAVLVAAHFVIS